MSLDSSPFPRASRPASIVAVLAVIAYAAVAFAAAPKATETEKTVAIKPPPKSATGMMSMGGMPGWDAPEQYSVDMVITHDGKPMTMTRYIDGPKIRTDIQAEGQTMQMIELGDAAGTSLMVMPSEKKAMKRTVAGTEELMKMAPVQKKEVEGEPAPETGKIELVGKEKMNGRECEKYKCTYGEGTGYAWVDAAEHFPVRMEFGEGQMDWKNYNPGPQPAALFEVPKGYEVIDMDEMMKKMTAMKSDPRMAAMMGGMGGVGGMPGMGGMGGGVSGMANNMAGNYGGQMGSQMGSQFGGALGASLGGPLGMMAGNYIGGKVGGMIGRKVARAVMPGK